MAPQYPGQAARTLRERAQNLDPNSQQYANIRQRLQGIRERRAAPPPPPAPMPGPEAPYPDPNAGMPAGGSDPMGGGVVPDQTQTNPQQADQAFASDVANSGYQAPGPMQPPVYEPPPVPQAANYTGVASVLRNQMRGVDPNSQRGQYLRGRLQNVRDIRRQYPGGNY